MSIREGTNRKVSFDTRDKLGDEIDKLTVMLGRLAAKDNNKKHLKCKYIMVEEKDEIGILVKETIRIETGQTIGQVVEIEDSSETGPDLSRITEEAIFKVPLGDMVDKTGRQEYRDNSNMMVTIEVGIDQGKGHSQGFTVVIELEVKVVVDSRSESRASTNRDMIRC